MQVINKAKNGISKLYIARLSDVIDMLNENYGTCISGFDRQLSEYRIFNKYFEDVVCHDGLFDTHYPVIHREKNCIVEAIIIHSSTEEINVSYTRIFTSKIIPETCVLSFNVDGYRSFCEKYEVELN